MVVAMTKRHWHALVTAAGIESEVLALEQTHGLDLTREADRYQMRDEIKTLLSAWSSSYTQQQVADALQNQGALWGPYQTFSELLENDKRASTANPMIQTLQHPSAGNFRIPGSTIRIPNRDEGTATAGPIPGADTQDVLRAFGIDPNITDT
jgi:2-methylfumaryl-CoA isomerase